MMTVHHCRRIRNRLAQGTIVLIVILHVLIPWGHQGTPSKAQPMEVLSAFRKAKDRLPEWILEAF